jgi:hypothetical protein
MKSSFVSNGSHPSPMGIQIGGRGARGGRGDSQRSSVGNANRQGNQFSALEIKDDEMADSFRMATTNMFYNGATPLMNFM